MSSRTRKLNRTVMFHVKLKDRRLLLLRWDEINSLRYVATVADLISVRKLNAYGSNRSRDRRVTEHLEIESHRSVSRETEKSKAVFAPRIPDQFVAILGNSS